MEKDSSEKSGQGSSITSSEKKWSTLKINIYIFLIFVVLYAADMYISTRRMVVLKKELTKKAKEQVALENDREIETITDEEVEDMINIDSVWNDIIVPDEEGNISIFELITRAFYFATITHSTVGYGDIYPSGNMGRSLVVFHIMTVMYINIMY